jgi:pimeloyl-ACP methyl ester carboxylesterase
MNKTAALAMGWGRLAFSDTENAGCPTVFLHGTGCDRADWQETFDGLSDKVRIIAPEFRGHGLSEVPRERFTLEDLVDDVLALVQALDLERPLFVGHSLGGMVAMALARKTENVAGLVLLEGVVVCWPGFQRRPYVRRFVIR